MGRFEIDIWILGIVLYIAFVVDGKTLWLVSSTLVASLGAILISFDTYDSFRNWQKDRKRKKLHRDSV